MRHICDFDVWDTCWTYDLGQSGAEYWLTYMLIQQIGGTNAGSIQSSWLNLDGCPFAGYPQMDGCDGQDGCDSFLHYSQFPQLTGVGVQTDCI